MHTLWFPLIFIVSLVLKTIFWWGFIFEQLWPLSDIPGPRWAAYTRFWLIKTLASGHSAEKFVDINKRYGPIARIGPNHLLTDDPDLTRRILAAGSRYTRAPWFDSIKINPHEPNIVSERDTRKHNQLRYKLSNGYTGKGVDDIEQIVDEHLLDWVRRIDTFWVSQPSSSKVFDIGKRIQFLTVDLITHLCLGEAFGCIESDSDKFDFLSTVQAGSVISQQLSVLLEFNSLLFYLSKIPVFRRLLVPSADDKRGIGKIMGVIRKAVDRRLESETTPKRDMLGLFLEKGISRDHIQAELFVTLVAGSDTTSTSVQGTLLAIISDPRVYRALRSEIDTALFQGWVSSPIQDIEARRLPYLQACIMEGLRRYPPLSQLRERLVPPEGDVIHGYRVPGGTFIGLNAWGTQINEVYGNDPEVFRPERWFITDGQRLKAMYRTHELIFGHGSTKCLGIQIATMELNKIFFELLRQFDISTINPTRPWKSTCYGIFFQEDFNVRITRRE
ncbi:MAG: hypothetical protein Q9187_002005 [Circinaria calcarea]